MVPSRCPSRPLLVMAASRWILNRWKFVPVNFSDLEKVMLDNVLLVLGVSSLSMFCGDSLSV